MVVIFLLNVMDVFSVGGGGGVLLDIPCMVFQRMACSASVHISVHSIGFV